MERQGRKRKRRKRVKNGTDIIKRMRSNEEIRIMEGIEVINPVIQDTPKNPQFMQATSEIPQLIPDTSEIPQLIPDTSEIPQLIPDTSEDLYLIQGPHDDSQFILSSDDPQFIQGTYEDQQLIQATSEYSQLILGTSEDLLWIQGTSKDLQLFPDTSEDLCFIQDAPDDPQFIQGTYVDPQLIQNTLKIEIMEETKPVKETEIVNETEVVKEIGSMKETKRKKAKNYSQLMKNTSRIPQKVLTETENLKATGKKDRFMQKNIMKQSGFMPEITVMKKTETMQEAGVMEKTGKNNHHLIPATLKISKLLQSTSKDLYLMKDSAKIDVMKNTKIREEIKKVKRKKCLHLIPRTSKFLRCKQGSSKNPQLRQSISNTRMKCPLLVYGTSRIAIMKENRFIKEAGEMSEKNYPLLMHGSSKNQQKDFFSKEKCLRVSELQYNQRFDELFQYQKLKKYPKHQLPFVKPILKHTQSKAQITGTWTLENLAEYEFVNTLISRPNITSCYSFIPSLFEYEHEFKKFLDFVGGLEKPGKCQLANAIFPLFVNFYLNMVHEIHNARKFYKKFVHIFQSAKRYKRILKELYKIESKKKMEKHFYFKNFRIQKYILRVSNSVLNKLKAFLKDIESRALRQSLSLFFYFEDPDVELSPSHSLPEPEPEPDQTKIHYLKETSSYEQVDFPNDMPVLKRAIFESAKPKIYTVDVNKNFTELCVTSRECSICILPIGETKTMVKHSKEMSGGSDSERVGDYDCEKYFLQGDKDQDYFPKNFRERWIHFPGPVQVAKYFPNLPHVLLAASETEIIKANTVSLAKKSLGNGHTSRISDIDINSNGSLFCTASSDKSCRLWSTEKSSVVKVYSGHNKAVNSVKFHPSGNYLISGSRDCNVRIWSIESSICVRCFVQHKASVNLVACCSGRKKIASADSDNIVKLWDIQDNLCVLNLKCCSTDSLSSNKITAISFGNENFLGVCNSIGEVQIWDIRLTKRVYFEENKETTPVLLVRKPDSEWNILLREKKNSELEDD